MIRPFATISLAALSLALATEARAQTQPDDLNDIVVTAQRENATQIVNGGSAGVLGDKPAEDLPFAIRSYDETLILNQQPQTLGDVLENDPTIRLSYGFGNAAELFVIRGFALFGDDIGLNGLYGVTPDITTMGKIIGGGLPVGAYGGRNDVMAMVAPLGAMYQAGTLSGNPLAVSAGIATLKELQKPGTFERLETLAQRLTDGLTKSFQAVEIPSTINRVGSMFTGFFNAGPVTGLAHAEGSDTSMYGRYFHAMQNRGVYIAPSQFEAGFVSTAHTEADIDATITKASKALSSLR